MKIVIILKSQNHIKTSNSNGFFNKHDDQSSPVNWEKLFKMALENKQIDSSFVNRMHSNYDLESQRFIISHLDTIEI